MDPFGLCKEDIQKIPKGDRPEPATYLPESYIATHLAKFDNGASRFMTKRNLDKYGPGQRDGTSFVMPSSEADKLIARAGSNKKTLEDAPGLPRGTLDGNELLRVDFANPEELGLRIPSGNEAGANDLWLAGGKLPDGSSEAVIDVGDIPTTRLKSTKVSSQG